LIDINTHLLSGILHNLINCVLPFFERLFVY
jgi:hypothetical protein